MICAIVKETAKKETAEERKKRLALRDAAEKKEAEEKKAKESLKYTLPKATEILRKYIRKEPGYFANRLNYLEKIKVLENEIINKCLNDKSIFSILCGEKKERDLSDVFDLIFSNYNELKDRIIKISRLQKLFKMDLKLNLNELDATLLQYYCTTDMDLNKVIEEIEQKSSVKIKLELLSIWKGLVGKEKWKNILEKKLNDIYNIFQAENFVNFMEKLRVYDDRIDHIMKFKEIIGHEIFEKEMMVNLPILYGTICRSPLSTFRDAFLYLYNNQLSNRYASIKRKVKSIHRLYIILGEKIFKKERQDNIKNIYRFLGEGFGTDTFNELCIENNSKYIRWTLLLKLKETFGEIIFKNDLPLVDLYKLILGEENFEKIKNEKNIHIEVLKKIIDNDGYSYRIIRKLLKYKKLLGKYFFDIFKENSMEIAKLIFRKKSDEIITIKDIFQLIRLNSSSLQDYWDRLLQIKELFGDYWNQFVKENLNEYYRYLCSVKRP